MGLAAIRYMLGRLVRELQGSGGLGKPRVKNALLSEVHLRQLPTAAINGGKLRIYGH